MRSVLFMSRKGGTGKSTLTCSVADTYAKKGFDAFILDGDPMGSSINWFMKQKRVYPNGSLTCEKIQGDLRGPIEEAKKKYDIVLIDTPGSDCIELRSSLLSVETAILTLKSSDVDMDTKGYMQDLVLRAKEKNPKLKIKTLVTMVDHYISEDHLKHYIHLLSEAGLSPFPTAIQNLEAFHEAMAVGISVQDLRSYKAKKQINSVLEGLESE
ncbi:MAG: ParA family protein [Pseudobacteriovorax sp.]|nr:ParA family protein [Pseudobacteriovorax sp.]